MTRSERFVRLLPKCTALLAGCLVAACGASTPSNEDRIDPNEPTAPFIKLAKRELGLVLYWRGSPAPPGYQEDLERLLVEHFRTTYRTPTVSFRQEGSYVQLSPELMSKLVDQGVDDVVVVEVEQKGKQDGPMFGDVRILSLATQDILHSFRIPELKSKKAGRPTAPRFADFVWLTVRKHWTDPGASPELDPLTAADILADRQACAHAIRIYDKHLDQAGPSNIGELQRFEASRARREKCHRVVQAREAILKDQAAVYSLSIEVRGCPRGTERALRGAIKDTRFERMLKSLTNKPVLLTLHPGVLELSLRFQPDRYRAWLRDKKQDGRPQLDFAHWAKLMVAMSELVAVTKETAAEAGIAGLGEILPKLRLTKLLDDYVMVDFAVSDGRPLLTTRLRAKVGSRGEVAVTSLDPDVTRSLQFVLGPSKDGTGTNTNFDLLYRFFELEHRE